MIDTIAGTITPISFIDLISADNKIQIPIIQRDFAYGRSDKENSNKRERFLKSLHTTLVDVNKTTTLDFVYGEQKGDLFSPLDGQQRLTVLFLLHWYIGVKENKLNELKKYLSARFTYKTRISSREFCEILVEKCDKLFTSDNIKDCITKSSWFVLSWEKDPTIKGMLTTLVDMQKIFSNTQNIWDRLVVDKAITFINIPLKDFGLSDDLYIKMNARGKPLTPFENWKADFEKVIRKNKWERGITFEDTFDFKIDTKWTNLFWRIRNDKHEIDNYMLNFIYGVQLNWYCMNKDISNLSLMDKMIDITYDISSFNEASFNNLCETLSLWQDIDNFKCDVNLWQSDTKLSYLSIFEQFCKLKPNELTYTQRALFYAQTLALSKNVAINSQESKDWIRVVRNCLENTPINKPSDFKSCLQYLEEISNCIADGVYNYLASCDVLLSWANMQITEEIVKAKIGFNDQFVESENNQHLRGNICCLLNLAMGALDNTKNDPSVLLPEIDRFDKDKFAILYNSYMILSEKNFESIWGDMITTEVYSIWANRLFYNNDSRNKDKYYKKNIGLMRLVEKKSQHINMHLDLSEFITKNQQEFVVNILNKYSDITTLKNKREILYLYHIYSSQICNKDIFANKWYNFSWVQGGTGYKSYFGDEVFQTYNARTSSELDNKRTIWIELTGNGRPQVNTFVEKLKDWANHINS